jgi:ribosome-associated protein
MPPADRLIIDSRLAVPMAEIELRASRSSGPGGQHANVTASRIEAVFDVEASPTLTEEQKHRIRQRCGPRVTAVAQDARSQARNRELALERLATRIAKALHRPKSRRATKPGRAAKERRLSAKRRRGEKKRLRQAPPPD